MLAIENSASLSMTQMCRNMESEETEMVLPVAFFFLKCACLGFLEKIYQAFSKSNRT